MNSLDSLFKPNSVAIIGASADPTKTSGLPGAYLIKRNFSGEIYFVNPRYPEMLGKPCYPDIASIPNVPDMAIILLGAKNSIHAVKELADKGCKAAIVLASGFAELGEEGQLLQQQLLEARGNMRLLGPNTIGLMNLTDNIALSASSALEIENLHAGPVAIVSQSGGIVGSILSRAAGSGLGLSKLVATSNEADLDVADMVDYLSEDESTKIILLYLEGVRHPAKFELAAKKARLAGKTLIVYKIGKSESGARSAASHTGAMAGEDRVYDQFFKQNQVLRADYFSDLIDFPVSIQNGKRLKNNRIAILTSSGGAATLIADNLGLMNFEMPLPNEVTAQTLRTLDENLPIDLGNNPIDVTLAGLKPELLKKIIATLLASDDYDAIVVVVGSSALAMPDLMAGAIREGMGDSNKPIFAYISPYAPQLVSTFIRQGIPAFAAPEGCARGLKALWQISQLEQTNISTIELTEPFTLDQETQALGEFKGTLNEHDAKALFAKFGMPMAREKVITTSLQATIFEAEVKKPLVLKILSDQITHKTDVGGVVMNLRGIQVGAELEKMRKNVLAKTGIRIEEFLIQEMLPKDLELFIGVKRDILGLVLIIGSGGITAEVFNDSTVYLLPSDAQVGINEEVVLQMLQSLTIWPLMNGFRGIEPLDIPALVKVVQGFVKMAQSYRHTLLEAEVNPILMHALGHGVTAVDAVAVFEK
ncbi:acetate--CoA ligase family protein [Polynucleobacter rarus]|uniref:acetate--CoA ligase family protein n=1 Tax=Polynucleobacter rarus TaxID=556055 RepID=UPI000D3E4462|nr:acetate--CoA ligase family protein [Polynucleobacter rarus]